jgi:hypothetical protein
MRMSDCAVEDLRPELYQSTVEANADDIAGLGGAGTLLAKLHPSLLVFSAALGCKQQLLANPLTAASDIFSKPNARVAGAPSSH